MHVLITLYTKVIKKKLYCCYIDYRKAFDSVPRVHLWYKLLKYGVNGKILNVIKNVYKEAKSAIKLNNPNCHGMFFGCDIGVRQGDNLSPLLFALYLNDLQEFLSMAYDGLENVWHDTDAVIRMSSVQFKTLYKKKLRTYFVNKWVSSMREYSKCSLYRNFKTVLVMDKYLLESKEPYRLILLKFRTSNHLLPIEKGRHLNIDINERKCELCNMNDIGDEYHYVCCCTKFRNLRTKFIPRKFHKKPSVQKFCDLMVQCM